MGAKITIQDLLEAGVHFGHQVKRWNPKMKNFVYGSKNGIYIIDLTKTMNQLAQACDFLHQTVAKGGSVLFVGTKRQAQEIVRESADKTGMFHISERWLGGTLTNHTTIRKSIHKMCEIDTMLGSDNIKMTKKEQSSSRRNGEKLHRNLDGIKDMTRMPDVLLVIDICKEDIAVREAQKLGIPIVAIVDTNANPEEVLIPIPANDDAIRSIKVIMDVLTDAIADAGQIYKKRSAEEEAERAKKKADDDAEKAKKSKEMKDARDKAKKEKDAKDKEVKEAKEKKRTEKPAKAEGAADVPAEAAVETPAVAEGQSEEEAAKPKAKAKKEPKAADPAEPAAQAPVEF